MAKFRSSKVNSETILIIFVIVVAIIVVVYFLNKKQECFDDLGNCPFTPTAPYSYYGAARESCKENDTCLLGSDKYTCYVFNSKNANGMFSNLNGQTFWSKNGPTPWIQ